MPKPVPKTFPVCTIRSTPSQPIHCIVWAKDYLLALVFNLERNLVAILTCTFLSQSQLFGEDQDGSEELDEAEKKGENGMSMITLLPQYSCYVDL